MADLDRGLEAERAAAVRAAVALLGSRRSAKRGSKSRPASTPRRCQPVAVRAGDELALAQRLVGDHLALEANRAERPRVRAEGRADLLVGGGPDASPSAATSFASSSRSSPRTSASTTVPSSFVTGIAFDVAAASIGEQLCERLDRRHVRRLDLLRRVQRLGKAGARGIPRAISRSAA